MEHPSTSPDTVPAGATSDEEAATLAFSRLLNPDTGTPSATEPEAESLTPAPEAAVEGDEAQAEPADTEDPDDDPPADDVTILKVGDTEYEVPAALAKEFERGTLRQSDYSRKTAELAKAQKAADQAAADGAKAYADKLAEYGQRIAQLTTALNESSGEPDWETLQQQDPVQFAAEWAKWQVKQSRRHAVEVEAQRVQQEQARLQQEADTKALAKEQESLLAAVPEWNDPEKAKAELTAMVEYGKRLGFTAEELGSVTNHRLILLLRDGARYQSLAAKVKQIPVPAAPVKVVAKTPTPAAPTSRSKTPELTKMRQRLAKTGDGDDAAPIFLSLIQAERAHKAR